VLDRVMGGIAHRDSSACASQVPGCSRALPPADRRTERLLGFALLRTVRYQTRIDGWPVPCDDRSRGTLAFPHSYVLDGVPKLGDDVTWRIVRDLASFCRETQQNGAVAMRVGGQPSRW
jgi:hypothetical protein